MAQPDRDRVLDKKYRLGGVLHQGERAVVLEATHLELRERVAVKILQKSQSDPRFVARLRREARQATRIRSEHVVRYLDIGHLADGRPYVVMERLTGEPLSERVAREPLALAGAVDVMLQVCEALAAAHVRGILHRDLRTSNVFCLHGPLRIKVLNFGTGRASDAQGVQEDEGLTVAALAVDAPEYKAPEQIIGKRDLDVRTDIWALGIILFEILTGRHPFAGATMQETVQRILAGEVPRDSIILPNIASVIARCLKQKREERFTNVADLADALAPYAGPSTAFLPARIRQILDTPAADDDAEAADELGNAPTVVREVLSLAQETTSATSGHTLPIARAKDGKPVATSGSVAAHSSGPASALPRLDGGKTGARSFPWLKMPTRVAQLIKVQEKEQPRDRAKTALTRAAQLGMLAVGVAMLVGAIVLFTRRIVVDVHIESQDPTGEKPGTVTTRVRSTASSPSGPAPKPAPAVAPPEEAADDQTGAEADTAAPDAVPPPTAEARPRPRSARTPRSSSTAAPKAPPSGRHVEDPWGWER